MWAPHSQVLTCISFVNCVCLFEEEWLGEVCFLNGVINVQTAKASQKRHKDHGQEALEEIIKVPSDF